MFGNFLRLRRGSGMLVVEYHHGGEASVTPDTLSKTLWYGLDVSDFPKVLCYILKTCMTIFGGRAFGRQ